MEHKFGEILVPTEEVVEIRGGQKRRSERKFFPGYVFVQMMLDDDTWHLVRRTLFHPQRSPRELTPQRPSLFLICRNQGFLH